MPAILIVALPVFAMIFMAWGIAWSSNFHADQHQSFWQGFWAYITGKQYTAAIKSFFAQTLTNAMSKVAAQVDAPMGAYFHGLAQTVRNVSATLNQIRAFTITLIEYLQGHASRDDLAAGLRAIRASVNVAERTAETALHRERALERRFTAAVAQGVYPRLGSLEHKVDRTIPREIASARELARDAADRATQAFRWAKSHVLVVGTAAFAGAVAWALGQVGAGWTRCNNNQGWGRAMCGLSSDIAQILIDGLALFAVGEGIVVFAEHIQGIVHEVSDLTNRFWQVPTSGPGGDRAIGSPTVSG